MEYRGAESDDCESGVSWFANLRLLVFARRACRSLESIADSQRIQAQLAEAAWDEKYAVRKPKPMVMGEMSVAEVNKNWRRQRALETGIEEDELDVTPT